MSNVIKLPPKITSIDDTPLTIEQAAVMFEEVARVAFAKEGTLHCGVVFMTKEGQVFYLHNEGKYYPEAVIKESEGIDVQLIVDYIGHAFKPDAMVTVKPTDTPHIYWPT